MNINRYRQHYSDEDLDRAAAPIIKKIVSDYLKEFADQPIALKTLRSIVKDTTEREYSNGSFSGAMRDLIEESDGRILNVERGYYVYLKNFKRLQILRAIEKFSMELDNIATDNILELTNEDIDIIRRIPRIKEELQNLGRIISK